MGKRKKSKEKGQGYSSISSKPSKEQNVLNEPGMAYMPALSSFIHKPLQVAVLNVRDREVILGSNLESRTEAYDIYHEKKVTLSGMPIGYDQKMEMIDLAKEGVNARAIARLADLLDVSQKQAAEFFHFSERTLRDYVKSDKLLDTDSSEKIIKMFSLYLFGISVFENPKGFINWLFKPSFGLGNRVPADLLYSSGGIDLVYDELSRIEYGDFA